MKYKTRAHKLITNFVKTAGLEYTVKEIMANISDYGVKINNIEIKNRLEWVIETDQIELLNWPIKKAGDFQNIKIIADYKDYLVVYKPINVVVEAGAGHTTDNLISWLTVNYSSLKGSKFTDTKPEFLLANRLDKDTQGIMLIAKNLETQQFFQDQFRNRTVVKKYLAVVDKYVDKLWINTHYQARNSKNPLKQKLFWDQKSAEKFDENYRIALTEIKPLAYLDGKTTTLIEVNLQTGRMHQIRLLCEELGFPVLNDKVYNRKITPTKSVYEMAFTPKEPVIELNAQQASKLIQEAFVDEQYLLSNYLEITEPYNNSKQIYQIFDVKKLNSL